MSSTRHEQVKRLFLAAGELDVSKVAAFLDQACADDADLRQEVESLLAHHVPTTIFGESPQQTPDGKIARPAMPDQPPKPGQRFPPGTVIAGRYRVLGLLGRGGMGEVYRADDLKLNQPVALKFLARARHDDPAWLARFHDEVRLARKVSNPNVNRIHDLGEADGEPFISMEYVDGENLASLLRRIGRVTGDKARQITWQLCAGIGAAHDRGVLHRDLKPANIMIDGRGHVRIMDFGIATLASEVNRQTRIVGTPAYLAPELFRGEEPSVRSDLYALGMVLYQLVTGREPFDGKPATEDRADQSPTPPSEICGDIDPALEQIILQCLQPDPRQRPESAHAIAAALPGGDPLRAALAAGEIPSPGMVAAAGPTRGMRPRWAMVCLAVALAGLMLVVALANRTFLVPQAGLSTPPAVLAHQAKEVIRSLGHESTTTGSSQGFTLERGCLEYMMARHDPWADLSDGQPAAITFWYRQGDNRLRPPAPFGEPVLARKLSAEPGMKTVRLDPQGRLLEFSAVPVRAEHEETAAERVDWSVAFKWAGLDMEQFQSIPPVRNPPAYAQQVMAWEGENKQESKRIEAASLNGRVTHFEVVPPWQHEGTPSRIFVTRFVFYLVALAGGGLLAYWNLRRGLGDHQGAAKLALFVFVLAMLDWAVGERHVGVFVEEAASAYLWLARATFAAMATWICYLGLEPYVRRFWPQTMITWSRLLTGHFRDPLVGRDLLLGGMFGIGLMLIAQIDVLLPSWFGWSEKSPLLPSVGYELGELLGYRYKLGTLVGILLRAVSVSMVMLMLMLLLRVTVRNARPAAAIFCVVLSVALAAASDIDTFSPWMTSILIAVSVMLILTRVGLVALTVGWFVRGLLIASPLTTERTAWYIPSATFAVLVVTAVLVYGFWITAQPLRGVSQ